MSNSTDLLFKDICGSFTTCQYIQQSPRMSTVKLIKKNNLKKFYNISSDLIVYLGKKYKLKGIPKLLVVKIKSSSTGIVNIHSLQSCLSYSLIPSITLVLLSKSPSIL